MSINNSTLSEIIEILEEADAVISDQREIKKGALQVAKSAGYPPALVNKIVARRKKDRQEVLRDDADLRAFEEELGMEV